MKAIVYEKYGSPDVLQLQEIAKPAPKDDEVLIKVHAASINSRDWRLMRANPFFLRLMTGGLLKPKFKILGADLAGQVAAVGKNVTQLRPGDEVFGYLSHDEGGAYAEYTCAAEIGLALKPANCSFEQAAAVPLAAITALQGLRNKGNIQPGQKVLIQGASGGVGLFALQLAKAFGAEVTGVCSTRNLDMVRAMGADHAIDYTQEDFTQNGQCYDLILAANGYHPISHYLRSLSPEGSYVVTGGSMVQLFHAMFVGRSNSRSGGKKVFVVTIVPDQKDMLLLKELLESGKLVPVIDEVYPLEKTGDAFRRYEKVHPKGKIVISME